MIWRFTQEEKYQDELLCDGCHLLLGKRWPSSWKYAGNWSNRAMLQSINGTQKDVYGTLRFCMDYGELNKITKRDTFPLPHVNDYWINN